MRQTLVTPHFNSMEDVMEIHFQGEVDAKSIEEIVFWLRQALEYYHYERVVLTINSQGGLADALMFFISQLREYRLRHPRFILETVAGTESCSAAALMLSLGSVGHRFSGRDSRLVYHHSRIKMQDGASTADELGRLSERLSQTDHRMLVELCRHVHRNLGRDVLDLMEICCVGIEQGSCLGKQLALLKTLKNRTISAQVNKILQDPDDHGKLLNLQQSITSYLTRLKEQTRDLTRKDVLAGSASLASKLGYLLAMMSRYRDLFNEDRPLDPYLAMEYGLIDSIRG